MFQQTVSTESGSMRLSEVLADIGIDDRIVLKRRRAFLFMESIYTLRNQFSNNNKVYITGSQSEGTTTLGLESDKDILTYFQNYNVIQDLKEFEHGVMNFLMIQDETVSPGYCMLQPLRQDCPLPYIFAPNEHFFRDRTGRILLKNTYIVAIVDGLLEGSVQHGPAQQEDIPGYIGNDNVGAFPCKSWPIQAKQWLENQADDIQKDESHWPSRGMRRYCRSTGCCVVGVGSKGSKNEELEWRISTNLAERHLMFNLNITQLRCYVLMKMILKEFIKPIFGDTISSFMCKTVLFHCIAETQSNIWIENNLIVCLSLCLSRLYKSILREKCPHFIFPRNNLMRGKIPHSVKPFLLDKVQNIISEVVNSLSDIKCDLLGIRLQNSDKLHINEKKLISPMLIRQTSLSVSFSMKYLLSDLSACSCEMVINKLYTYKKTMQKSNDTSISKVASRIHTSDICALLGSILGSLNISQNNELSAEALYYVSLGLNTDVASSKLKIASMLYCTREIQRTEYVLRYIEESFDQSIVEPVCSCYTFSGQPFKRRFVDISDNHGEEAIQFTIAFCVRYLPCEINCIPTELKHEMFRSTVEDKAYRGKDDDWMDSAVVDSLTYLYFLRYKTYSYLRRECEKQKALSNLARTIDQEPHLRHQETAFNLLGQCMEHEGRVQEALKYYLRSLRLRRRNNAAKWLICILLSKTIHTRL